MSIPPKFGVTAGLSLGTQAELKNSFLGQDWGSGSCFHPPGGYTGGEAEATIATPHLRPKAALRLPYNLGK